MTIVNREVKHKCIMAAKGETEIEATIIFYVENPYAILLSRKVVALAQPEILGAKVAAALKEMDAELATKLSENGVLRIKPEEN